MSYFPELSELVTQTITAAAFVHPSTVDTPMLYWIFFLFGLEHSLKNVILGKKKILCQYFGWFDRKASALVFYMWKEAM